MMHSGQTFPSLLEQADSLAGAPVLAFWGAELGVGGVTLGELETDWHSHARGQLFCVENGLIRIVTRHGSFLLPPHRIGWMPPGEEHRVIISGPLTGWGVLLHPELARDLSPLPCVMGVSGLLRALVERSAGWSDPERISAERERMIAVLLDEIRAAPTEPLHLPVPRDPRLARIARRLLECPEDNRTLDTLARHAGLSERTARRLFASETGMSFTQWRQQARLALAMERLARREPVAEVADAMGYASASNFIAMFRRAFGAPPARFFARRGEAD